MKMIGVNKEGKKFKAACPTCGYPVEQFVADTVKRLLGEHMLREHGARVKFVENY